MTKIPDTPLRIVIAGCGGMSNAWIKYTLQRNDCQIVGLVDLVLENAKAMADKYNLPQAVIGNDLKQVLRQTSADLVYSLAIPAAHYEIALTAFSEDAAVFSEKPLAANMTEASSMLNAAAEAGLNFSVMQNRRYLKQIRALRQMLSEGTIGQIGYAGADFFLGPHFGGFRDLMESPLLLDMAIHTFDQARLITGANAVSVYCHEFNPPGSWYQGNASAIAIFEMDNGSVFCYRGSWCAEGAPTSWESQWRITGSQGTAIWDGSSDPYAEVVDPESEQGQFTSTIKQIKAPEVELVHEGHAGCLDELFDALLSGRPAETDAADNQHSLAMVMAAIESAKTGQKVKL